MANRKADSRHLRLCRKYWRKLCAPLTEVGRAHGYTLAVHGSLAYDFDLVGVPWVEDAAEPAVFVEALRAEAERVIGYCFAGPEESGEYFKNGAPGSKPHGRLVWSFHLGGGPYIDLSVLPRQGDIAKAPSEDGWYIAKTGRWSAFGSMEQSDAA